MSEIETRMMTTLSRLSLEEECDHVGTAEPLIRHLGLAIEDREPHESFMWDGTSFNSMLPDRHVFHDVAHWLVASPERRSIPEFGLGPGPETSVRLFPVAERFDDSDEIRAALLGALLQHEFGLPCGLIADEIGLVELVHLSQEPNAHAKPIMYSQWLVTYTWLEDGGLVNEDGIPTVVDDMRRLGTFPGTDENGSNRTKGFGVML